MIDMMEMMEMMLDAVLALALAVRERKKGPGANQECSPATTRTVSRERATQATDGPYKIG